MAKKKKPAKTAAKSRRPKDLPATKAKAVMGGKVASSDLLVTQKVNKASPILF
ncbi:MAG TPA: hypothetical protein VFV05_05305 [Methylomirabilota bacterium]|nr:hypothetical protein [Methylomirabilota bacterium]